MSLPYVIIGLGAVGGLWLAKAGPFSEHKASEPTVPGTGEGADSTRGAQPGGFTVIEPYAKRFTVSQEALAQAVAKPESPGAVDTTVVADPVGPVLVHEETTGTKLGGTVPNPIVPGTQTQVAKVSPTMPVAPVSSTPKPPTSLTTAVLGTSAGITPRTVSDTYKTWGSISGALW